MRTRPSLFTEDSRLTLSIKLQKLILHFARINKGRFEFFDDRGNYFALDIATATKETVNYYRGKMIGKIANYSSVLKETGYISIEHS